MGQPASGSLAATILRDHLRHDEGAREATLARFGLGLSIGGAILAALLDLLRGEPLRPTTLALLSVLAAITAWLADDICRSDVAGRWRAATSAVRRSR